MNKSKALRVTLCTLTLIALFMLALLATIIFIGSNVAYAADGYIIGATSAALTTAQIAGIAVGGVVAGALTCFAVVSIIAEIRQKRKEEKIKKAEEAKKAAQKKQPVKKEQPKKQEQPKKENSAKIEEEKRKIDEEEAAKKAEEERIAAEKAAEERKIAEEATKKAQEEAEAQKAAEEAKRIEEERIAAERKAEEEKRKLIEEEAANKTEIVQDASMEDEEEDDEGIIEKTDESGRVFFIRYNKSFTAKLTQASDEVQGYYETLKNAILSYKKTTSRVSWFYDSVNSGRQNLLKFNIRGKTLVVYFAFDPAKFDDTKYNVEAVTSKKYETVPCLYRINGPLKCKFALELIDLLAQEYGLTKGEEQNENYHLKYKTTEVLLSEGLIKEYEVKAPSVVPAKKVEEPILAIEQPQDIVEDTDDEEEEEVVEKVDVATGEVYYIRYNKSLTAKLSLASDEVKGYYNELKNALLSYKKVTSRMSWPLDSINSGRINLAKLSIRGKTLVVYFAMDPASFEGTKYNIEVAKAKKYEAVPALYRINGPQKFKFALELIEKLAEQKGLLATAKQNENYIVESKTIEQLLEEGLIKEVKVKGPIGK